MAPHHIHAHRRSATTLLIALATLAEPAWAQSTLPTGGHVAAGSATINAPVGNTLTINQNSSRAVVNWNSFSIGQQNAVDFNQPSSSAAILNRVTGGTSSSIAGQIDANGQVYLVNPNGIAITSSGSVQVGGGFVASTLGITDSNFMSGNLSFTGNGASAPVSNAGSITAGQGGFVALVGGTAANSGVISVPLGEVALGSGEAATLDLNGDGFMQVAAPTGATTAKGQALVSNSGRINAPGGNVEMMAATVAGAIHNAVNLSGVVAAQSVSGHDGAITLSGGPGGAVNVTGTLDAAAPPVQSYANAPLPTGNGGAITVSGARVRVGHYAVLNASGAKGGTVLVGVTAPGGVGEAQSTTIASGAQILAEGDSAVAGSGGYIETSGDTLKLGAATISAGPGGTWLADPVDLSIDQNAAAILNYTLGTGTSITVQTTASTASGPGIQSTGNGNIDVNAALSWNTSATLTLSAYNNIVVSAPITVSGGGTLVLTYNTGSTGGTLIFEPGTGSAQFTSQSSNAALYINNGTPGSGNGTQYTLLFSESAIDGMASSGNYALAAPLTFANSYTASVVASFSGNFNGLGNTISNLTINSSGDAGLFGAIGAGGTVASVGILGGTIKDTGINSSAGALAASNSGTISNSYSTATIDSSAGTVTTGGLVGSNGGTITMSFATGTVNGGTGAPTGGLVGNNGGTITQSYETGAVSTIDSAITGGLVGQSSGSIADSYATGAVACAGTGCPLTGGFIGELLGGATITNAYSTGTVNVSSGRVGGFAGGTLGTLTNTYWDTVTSGTGTGDGGNFGTGSPSPVDTPTLAGSTVLAALNTGATLWTNVGNRTTPYLISNPGPVFLASDTSATPTAYNPVSTIYQLQAIGNTTTTLAQNYLLTQNIDATGFSGWVPIGGANQTSGFSGVFDGLGFNVANLAITSGTSISGSTVAGVFALLSGTVENVGLVGGSVSVAGDPAGTVVAGGLAGSMTGVGTILNSYSTEPVTVGSGANSYAGGLVGSNGVIGGGVSTLIINSYASGAVTVGTGTTFATAGGLAGFYVDGTIFSSYATGAVTGGTNAYVGGLIGDAFNAQITAAYATGAVTGGGTGAIVGGLIGLSTNNLISQVYAANSVSSGNGSTIGGLIGLSRGDTFTDAYWDTARSISTGAGVLSGNTGTPSGLSGSQSFTQSSYGGFTFVSAPNTTPSTTPNQWYMVDSATLPILASEYSTTINNAHQLQLIALSPNASYVLGNDIDASATASAVASGTGSDVWSSSGFAPLTFGGAFNGQGYVITNLSTNLSAGNVGLFGQISVGGSVQNVGLVGGSITGATVGALAGVNSGAITNAYSNATVAGSADTGGLVGTNDGTISNTYSTGAVSGGSNTGGLVGTNNTTIENSYAIGAVRNGTGNMGGLVGLNQGLISTSYSAGRVTSTSSATIGGFIGLQVGGTVSATFWDEDRSGVSIGIGSGGGPAPTPLSGSEPFNAANYSGFTFVATPQAANNTNAWVVVNTDGSLNSGGTTGATMPMLASEYSTTIQNAHQLQLIALDPTANYKLGRSIDASATGTSTSPSTGSDVWGCGSAPCNGSFAPIGGFTGTLDGGGNTISGLTINSSLADVGLFQSIGGGATVQNLGLIGGSVTGTTAGRVGALTGLLGGTVSDVYATTTVSDLLSTIVGGLVGDNTGTIAISYANGAVTGGASSNVGGLVGFNENTIELSFAAGAATGGSAANVGGLAGRNTGNISDVYAVGSVVGGAASFAGGLVGVNTSSITNAYATGVVSGRGGLVAAGGGLVTDGYWDTGTTGLQNSSGGTPQTTTQLQAGLPIGFSSSTWGIIAGKSYPYLCWQFGGCGETPQVVSGTVYKDLAGTSAAGSGIAVTAFVNGSQVSSVLGATVSTGANGYYYDLFAPNTIPPFRSVLTFAQNYSIGGGQTASGATLSPANGASATGVNILANTLYAITNETTYSAVQSDLDTAAGLTGTAATLANGLQNQNLRIDASGAFTVDGVISTGTLTLNAGGAIGETGAITAETLTGSSAGDTVLNNPNNIISNVAAFSTTTGGANGNFTLVDDANAGNALNITGAINAGSGTVSLTNVASGGPLSASITEQTGGSITAGTLTGSASGNAFFQQPGNQIANLGPFTETANANFALTDARLLTVSGTLNAGSGFISLTTTGAGSNLVLDANLIATGNTVSLVSAGTITKTAINGITAATLTGSAGGTANLVGANAISTLGSFTVSGGDFVLAEGGLTGTVTVSGPVRATNITIGSGEGVINVTGTVAATATAEVGGVTTVGVGSGGDITGAAVVLFTNAGIALTGTAAVGSAGGIVDFGAPSGVTQAATSVITAGTLQTNGTSLGATSLLGTGNAIASLGFLTMLANASFSLVDSQALTVTGPVGSGSNNLSLTTTSGGLTLNGNLNAGSGNTVTLTSAGSITQGSGASITAGTLTGSSAGNAFFTQSNNVSNLGPFSTTTGGNNGVLNFVDNGATPLTVNGTLTTGTGGIFLNTKGPLLTVSAPLLGTGELDLIADTMALGAQIGGSAVNAGQASAVLLEAFTPGRPVSLGAGATTGLALTDTALNNIRSTGVAIGEENSGPITFDGAFTAAANFGTDTSAFGFHLATGASAEFSAAITLQGGFGVDAGVGTTITQNAGSITAGANSTIQLVAGSTITQNGGTIDPTSLLIQSGGSVSLPDANVVDTLAASITGLGSGLVFNNTGNPLAIGMVGFVSGITTNSGNVALSVVGSGGLTINSPISVGSGALTAASVGNLALNSTIGGGVITLATNGNFTNTAGPAPFALAPSPGSHWLVYSTNPANDNDDGLTPSFVQYAASYNVGTLSGTAPAASGNGLLYSVAPVISVTNVTKTYDGTTALPTSLSAYSFSGAINGDSVSLNVSNPTGFYASANAGTGIGVTLSGVSVVASNGREQVFGYGVAPTNGGDIGTITAKTLTAGLTGTVSKIYDGTTAAILTAGNYTLSGVVGGDNVMLNDPTSGTYASANAGTGTGVSVSGLSLSGSAAGNYTLAGTMATGNIGTITPKALTAALTGTVSKVYDGTTAATLAASNYTLSGIVGSDNVMLNDPTSGTYASANAGTGIGVSVSGLVLTGSAAGNYTLAGTMATGNIGTITARPLTITADDLSRPFGQSNPPLTFAITSGNLVNGDSLTGAPTTMAALDSPSGSYPITQGTLAASANYTVTFVDGLLVVLPLVVPPTPNFGASPVKYVPPPSPNEYSSQSGLTQCAPTTLASTLQSQGSVMIFGAPGRACSNP